LPNKLGALVSTILEEVTDIVESLTGGFREGLKGLMDPLNEIVEDFQDIFDMIFEGDGLENFFKNLGEWIGNRVVNAFEVIAGLTEGMKIAVEFIKDFFDNDWPKIKEAMPDWMKGIGPGGARGEEQGFLGNAWDIMNPVTGGVIGNLLRRLGGERVDDAIITKRGDIVRTNPRDTLIATQSPEAYMSGGMTVSVNMGAISVNVTEGNARQAGENLAIGYTERLRRELDDAFRRAGR